VVPAGEVGAVELQASFLGTASARGDDGTWPPPSLSDAKPALSQKVPSCANASETPAVGIGDVLLGASEAACASGKQALSVVGLPLWSSEKTLSWPLVLFNTRSRLKYRAADNSGWIPGDEAALRRVVDAAFDGRLAPHFRSLSRPQPGAAPLGVMEVVGTTIGPEALEPVVARQTEVLLLLYAPWCGHSLNFVPLWHQLAAKLGADGSRMLRFEWSRWMRPRMSIRCYLQLASFPRC